MTKLPATIDEPQALTYAREHFAAFRDHKHEPYPGMGEFSWLDKSDSRRLIVQMYKAGALKDDMFMMRVCDSALNGSDVAYEAVSQLIIEFENNPAKTKPTALRKFTMEMARDGIKPERRSGPKTSNYYLRDIAISSVVFKVHLKFDLNPYRNEASPRESACSIVARAMREEKLTGPRGKPWTESAVVAIWKKYSGIAQMISMT